MSGLPESIWIVFTIAASGAQTARNAMQRELIGRLGAAGATHVRFLFALPFACLFLFLETVVTGRAPPVPGPEALVWLFAGATAQMFATGLMLAAMRDRSFVVSIAYTKTEPVFIALFATLVLAEVPGPAMASAIVLATVGVMLMSWPQAGAKLAAGGKPALAGISAGIFFALSAVGFRGGILRIETDLFVMAATVSLVAGLLIQCALILAWLSLADRPLLRAIAIAWRPSLLAGFMGAMASQLWFLAFATSTAARVRTLGLIEVPMAQIVTRRLFAQGVTGRETAGIVLVVAGVGLLIAG